MPFLTRKLRPFFSSRNEPVSLLSMIDQNRRKKSSAGCAALDNVSFQLQSGEIVAMIGPNGAGKTTLFNVLTGFIRPDNGQHLFQGQSLWG